MIVFGTPENIKQRFDGQIFPLMEKGKLYRMQVVRHYKKRSTGKGSQCNHINGHCQTIAAKLGYHLDTVKYTMKLGAVAMGYPYDTDITAENTVIPWSEARIDTTEASYLIDYIHWWVDDWNAEQLALGADDADLIHLIEEEW
jgi:hypothetical protein